MDKIKKRGFSIFTICAIALLLLMLTSCNSADNIASASRYNDVNILERDYVLFLEEMFIGDIANRSFLLPSIRESEKFHGINQYLPKLYNSLIGFYNEEIQEFLDFDGTVVQLATNRFLSVTAYFRGRNDNSYRFSFATSITIDLEQRREVLLSDLIDINDEFIQLFMDGGLIRTDAEHGVISDFGHALSFFNYYHTEDELRRALIDCSRPLSEQDRGNAFEKPSFYLTPNRIYFINFSQLTGHFRFYISLDDIEQFLKVDRW